MECVYIMVSVEELKNKEIEQLTENDLEIFELETLIANGVEEKVPIELEYKGKTFGAMIRPVNSIEWNNAVAITNRNSGTNNEIELCKIALYNTDGTPFNKDLINKLPAGIISSIAKEIASISGINFNSEENLKLVRKLMGF